MLRIYDPIRFKLTTPDGIEFIINKKSGVESITDNNGNEITIGRDGIIHSSGKSVLFERDLKAELFPLKTQMEIQFHMNMISGDSESTDQEGIQADLPII